jgi:hypothetical protein
MPDIELLINEEIIPLNEFIKNIFVNVCVGLIDSLKNIPEGKKSIKIEINL